MAERKRKTWLWIIGWILCFPIPLTILMLRNRKLPPMVRYVIIGVAWAVFLLFAAAGSCSKKSDDVTVGEQAVQETQTEEAEEPSKQEATSKEVAEHTADDDPLKEAEPSAAVKMIPDDTLKAFVRAYEDITGAELADVEQVGTQGFHATTGGHTIEMTYTTMNATIQIDNNGNFEDMRQVFHDAANALDPSLGDKAYSLFDEGVSMMSAEEDGFIHSDKFNADFSAPNEFEDGHIQLIVQK